MPLMNTTQAAPTEALSLLNDGELVTQTRAAWDAADPASGAEFSKAKLDSLRDECQRRGITWRLNNP